MVFHQTLSSTSLCLLLVHLYTILIDLCLYFASSQVYRRGLQAIPLSVDLWLHYLTYIKENSDHTDPETEGRIRA